MEPPQDLIDDIYRNKVLRARAMTPEERLLVGSRLFEYACTITREGIRAENPGISDEQVRDILGQRLALRRRLERRP